MMKKIFTLIAFLAVTIGAMAQNQYFYEWKDGKYIQRSLAEVDSITFSLPESAEKAYKYVDLGLPSGTLWADRNVGADSPEAYGDYFAWGETSTKSTYDWDTYKWCQSSNTTLTKYCTNSSYGTVDNKTVLDLEDDAAYVNMGAEWRMPTYDEQKELCNNCTWTWTTQNGTNGYKVTGPNGNSIFLPAAGYRNDSDLDDAGSYGYYWSASLFESFPNHACYLFFDSSNHYTNYYGGRLFGLTVRAVVSTVNEEPAPVVEGENVPVNAVLEVKAAEEVPVDEEILSAIEGTVEKAFTATLFVEGEKVQPAGEVTVKLPVTEEEIAQLEGKVIMVIAEDGTVTEVAFEIVENELIIKTEILGTFIIVAKAA